jgi:hypothetical protein
MAKVPFIPENLEHLETTQMVEAFCVFPYGLSRTKGRTSRAHAAPA